MLSTLSFTDPNLILTRKKFISNKLLIQIGGIFSVNDIFFIITNIRRATIFQISQYHYKDLGFKSIEECLETIKSKYKKFYIDKLIFLYEYKRIEKK